MHNITLIDIGIICFMTTFFIFTFIRNVFYKLNLKITNWDVIGLFPVWRFFAPVPGHFDYYLLYRDMQNDGELTEWKEVRINDRRQWFSFFWNPDKRLRKALLDVATDLANENCKRNAEVILSIPFLLLLNYVTSIPRHSVIEKTQFILLVFRGIEVDNNPEVLFISDLHKL